MAESQAADAVLRPGDRQGAGRLRRGQQIAEPRLIAGMAAVAVHQQHPLTRLRQRPGQLPPVGQHRRFVRAGHQQQRSGRGLRQGGAHGTPGLSLLRRGFAAVGGDHAQYLKIQGVGHIPGIVEFVVQQLQGHQHRHAQNGPEQRADQGRFHRAAARYRGDRHRRDRPQGAQIGHPGAGFGGCRQDRFADPAGGLLVGTGDAELQKGAVADSRHTDVPLYLGDRQRELVGHGGEHLVALDDDVGGAGKIVVVGKPVPGIRSLVGGGGIKGQQGRGLPGQEVPALVHRQAGQCGGNGHAEQEDKGVPPQIEQDFLQIKFTLRFVHS